MNKKLHSKILEASKIINNKSIRGNGDYIIVNQEIAKIIDSEVKIKERNKKINEILK